MTSPVLSPRSITTSIRTIILLDAISLETASSRSHWHLPPAAVSYQGSIHSLPHACNWCRFLTRAQLGHPRSTSYVTDGNDSRRDSSPPIRALILVRSACATLL